VPDLGNADAFESVAFQLRPGEVGAPISVPKGAAIIQLAQVVPEHTPTLDEVRARVEEDYRHDQSNVLAAGKAKQLAQQGKTEDFNKAAKAARLTPKQSKDFSQSEYVEGVGNGTQLAAAFTLDTGKTSEVVSLGANSVVFRVVSHTPANEADFPAQRDQLREELLDQKRNLAFEIYRQNLRQQLLRSGELRMNDAAMKQFLASYQTKQ
jgi:peptidyl-prolyl cis-trans isomerase D